MEINVAGAGAGKTTKMADLITEYDVPDGKKVFCIAFTNAAADNIMNHIKAKQGGVPKNIRISTIHSFLYQELIRPFYFLLFKKHFERISAINLPDPPQYKNIWLKELENENLLHFSSIPQRAKWIVDKKSGDNKTIKDTRKRVLSFISDYCAAIFIDEAQDIDDDIKLIIEALDKVGIPIFLYGDPKQDVKGFENYRTLINNAQSVHYDSCCHRCPQKHLTLSNTLAFDEEKQIADKDNAEGTIEIVFEKDVDNINLFMSNGSFELKYISKKTERFDTHENKSQNAQFDTLRFEVQKAMYEKWRDNTIEHEICRAAFYVTEQMFSDLANGLTPSKIINKWIQHDAFDRLTDKQRYAQMINALTLDLTDTGNIPIVQSIEKIKGLEAQRCLFILTTDLAAHLFQKKTDDNKTHHLLYVALTRSTEHLTVLVTNEVEEAYTREFINVFFHDYL